MVKGYCGLPGNERVDILAKMGDNKARSGTVKSISRQRISNCLKKWAWLKKAKKVGRPMVVDRLNIIDGKKLS